MDREQPLTHESSVSVIIATYDRPGPLRAALESVLAQTHGDWRAWVIGDGCGPETAQAVAAFADERIEYLNLPQRFGEQSGPNSVGLDLAEGACVAFLNHDDVWMPRHLERALAELTRTGADFYVGTSAIAFESRETPDGRRRPVFRETSPTAKDPWAQYEQSRFAFEPCSAWVVRAACAKRIGPWRSARTLRRTPLEDWILRAARAGASFHFGAELTTLKLNINRRKDSAAGGPSYTATSPEHEFVRDCLREGAADLLAEQVALDLRENPTDRAARIRRERTGALQKLAVSRLGHHLFRHTGIDLVSVASALRGEAKGQHLRRASLRRTGRELPDGVTIDALRATARSARRTAGERAAPEGP